MMTRDDLIALARSGSVDELISQLDGTRYAGIVSVYRETGDLGLCELHLHESEVAVYEEASSYLEGSPKRVTEELLRRFEVENLKSAVRLWFERVVRGRGIEEKINYLSTKPPVDDIAYADLVSADSIDHIAELLESTPYAAVVRNRGAEVMRRSSLFPLEIELDRFYFKRLTEAIEELSDRDRTVARALIGIQIDVENVERITRLEQFHDLSPEEIAAAVVPSRYANIDAEMLEDTAQGKAGEAVIQRFRSSFPGISGLFSTESGTDMLSRLSLIEKVLEEALNETIRKTLGGYPFTIGIVLSYCILAGLEINRIMKILNAKRYGMSGERIAQIL